jgi:rhodanese-related sulfurtransferase
MNGAYVLYVIIAVVVALYVRRLLVARSIVSYTPGEVEEKLRNDRNMFLLDVRTKREWDSGHIKSAHHIPLHELGRRFDELEKHKSKEIVCYCQTGNRSTTAAVRLKRLGFTTAHMKGGIAEWNFRNLR